MDLTPTTIEFDFEGLLVIAEVTLSGDNYDCKFTSAPESIPEFNMIKEGDGIRFMIIDASKHNPYWHRFFGCLSKAITDNQ